MVSIFFLRYFVDDITIRKIQIIIKFILQKSSFIDKKKKIIPIDTFKNHY